MRQAATILLLANRTAARGGSFEVLTIKRHSKARFMANVYVFPGGCLEDSDRVAGAKMLPQTSADPPHEFRVGALRELQEETSVALGVGKDGLLMCQAAGVENAYDPLAAPLLTTFAHWVTPKQEKYRYDTWFFAAEAREGYSELPLLPDPNEVSDVRWISPQDALRRHEDANDASFRLPPPTYIIMKELTQFDKAGDVLAHKAALHGRLPRIEPVLELDPAVLGNGTVIREMFMEKGWIPDSVIPKDSEGNPKRQFTFPTYDADGKQRQALVTIGPLPGTSAARKL